MLANAYSQYQNNSVLTASPAELTLMLYNGAIKFCNMAIEAIQNKDMQKSHTYIMRTQDIIIELQSTLSYKYEISKQFYSLYDYIKELLVEANIHKDEQKLLEAKEFIVEFRDLWKEMMKKK